MAGTMTPYDARAWSEIEAWRDKQVERKSKSLVPVKVRERGKAFGQTAKDKFEALPGAERFEEVLLKSLEGLTDLVSRTAMSSVRDSAVLKAYRKRGHDLKALEDIRALDLSIVDKVRPKLDIAYSAASAVEGAAAGALVAGGTLLATAGGVASGGAAAAPGAGTVIGAMAADAAAVLAASNRVVAHTAAYYGYDVEQPEERLFALGVLSVGVASHASKAAAYIELNKLVQSLARNVTWKVLDKNAVTKIVKTVYARLGMNLTKRKLGQAVPIVGIVIGAGLNAKMLARVADDANQIYRERLLRERYGLAGPTTHDTGPGGDEHVLITDIIDAEVIHDQEDPTASGAETAAEAIKPDPNR